MGNFKISETQRKTYHIVIPAIMPMIFSIIANTPVQVLGCRNRGLLALIIAFISAISALITTIIGVKRKVHGDKDNVWWLISTLILIIPVIALLILA